MIMRLLPRRQRQTSVERRNVLGDDVTALAIAAHRQRVTGAADAATGAVAACIALWLNAFGSAIVTGARLERAHLRWLASELAAHGRASLLIVADGYSPARVIDATLDPATGAALTYTVQRPGAVATQVRQAREVVHVVLRPSIDLPWSGPSPLKAAGLSSAILSAAETALSDVMRSGAIGMNLVTSVDSDDSRKEGIAAQLQSQVSRGGFAVVPSAAGDTTAGRLPSQSDWSVKNLTPDIAQAEIVAARAAAQEAVCSAFGVPPCLIVASTTGPAIREAQRHLAAWTLQPIADLIADALTRAELGREVTIDLMRPLQAYDTERRARGAKILIEALAAAKEAGIDPTAAMEFVDLES